jgi:chromatin remodeling complex protein RSC6
MADSMSIIDVIEKLTNIEKEVKGLLVALKHIKKTTGKRVKRPVDPDAPKKLNGFNKPVEISDALCDFMEVDHGSLLSRTDVTRKISAYINSSELKNPEKKTEIVIDKTLSKLLNLDEKATISFPQIQTHLKPHYPPAASKK